MFDDSYGAFLIHCGLTAMGNPSEDDTHPMHGELPHAKYSSVYIEQGENARGRYVAVGGDYRYRCAIETGYVFCPELRLYEGEKVLDMSCRVKNLRSEPFYYMYMAHINWMPKDGARLVYSAHKDSIEVFRGDFGSNRLDEFTTALENDPTAGDTIDFKTQCYDPELCVSMRYTADERGRAHAMQLRPDGTACYVGFMTSGLPYGLRWFSWTGEELSCGFALPNTGNHMGRAYAKEHGLRRRLGGGEEATLRYSFGKLDAPEAAAMEAEIARLLAR